MSAIIHELINYMLAFGGVITLLLFMLNFMTKGFLFQYLRVKVSQGRLILARVHSVTGIYYKPSKFEDGFFKMKPRSKEVWALPIADPDFKDYLDKELGVDVVDCDEQGKKLINYKFETTVQFLNIDPGRIESLLMRIKNRPLPLGKKEQFILIGLIIVVLVVLFIAFRVIKLEEAITALGALSGNI